MWKIKNGFVAKLAYLSGREKKRAFSCTLSVLAKKCFGPKQCKLGNTINIVVSAEIAQNQKWHLFWKEVFFDMGEKVGFTNCVFEKLCVCVFLFWKHCFYSVFREHSSCNTNTVCKQKPENWWKIVGCFWTWQKGVFCFFVFFQALMSLCFLSGKVARVLKSLFFQVFWGFVGWLLLVCLGLEGWVFLCFLLLLFFLVVFFFCLFALLCCGWMLLFLFLLFFFFFLFLFSFFVCFFVLCFFGGFKGQVRWPKGPPHLALNPPYLFVVFVCFLLFLFVCFLFCFFWRV